MTGPVPEPIDILDPADPRLDDFRDLAVADRRPDTGRGLVLAEGVPVVQRMLASRFAPHAIMGVAGRLDRLGPASGSAAPRYRVTADLMAEVVGFHLNRGVLAAARRPAPLDPADLLAGARTVIVLEGVNDHENIGSIFRNAAGLGADAVLFGPRCSDPLYRRAVRVSMGHVLLVPFATLPAGGWPGTGLAALRAAGMRIVALTPAGDTTVASAADADRIAYLVGAEGPGLTDEALGAADARAAIPMARGTDSLNVATATALALYERARIGH
ncbi:RNA methyltransferase [Tsukamurella sp. 8F]|uniref:TrmH family RNA methyltransferase n=1 Tax=unclassified Tsukamurella TaxID=2633480 RepID=UPI0023B8CB8F|nr:MULTISPECIES: RNA methyltransferase [unclassified Tsukamurella]MDF0529821.1 RNA methyltransferase [Tsukamurella sp. 8J]MDF0587013.1 RNA methyltransferase [Tsukamurella sp. 8F]